MRRRNLVGAAISCGFALLPGFAQGAHDNARRTMIVALDRDAYRARDLDLLVDQVWSVASARTDRIEVKTTKSGLDVTIQDIAREEKYADYARKTLTANGRYSIQSFPATSIRIDSSSGVDNSASHESRDKEFQSLEYIVRSLRTPLPGVTIEHETDSAIVHASDSSFGKVLMEQMGVLMTVIPLTDTSWRVSWNLPPMAAGPNAARRMAAMIHTDEAVRQLLGDPLDLDEERDRTGIEFTVRNPAQHGAFLDAVRKAFSHNPDFTISETEALVLVASQTPAQRAETLKQIEPVIEIPVSDFDMMTELNDRANPSMDVSVVGDAVSMRAKNAAYNDEKSKVVRQAFATRKDVVLTTASDGSLLIRLAPGAHLAPVQAVGHEQIAAAIQARLDAASIKPIRMKTLASERTELEFASNSDAEKFRRSLSGADGLSIRLVDDTEPGNDSAKPPSPGDERLPQIRGGFIWLRPDTILTGNMVADASTINDEMTDSTAITFRLTEDGRARFASATRQNVGIRFAIVIDGKVPEAPVIREPIEGGEGQITGGFTTDSANSIVRSILSHRADLPLIVVGADTPG